jgi:predicted outer membrane repeat protein
MRSRISSWNETITKLGFKRKKRKFSKKRFNNRQLRLESLEDRRVLAADVTVSNLSDTIDGTTTSIAALIGSPGTDGTISLREAILAAYGTSGANSIDFNVTGTITLTGGQLSIDDDLTIEGSGVNNLTIDGDELSRVFYVNSGSDVTISDLTITGGEVTGANVNGGGIYSAGNLILDHVTVEGNSTESSGGGVYSTGGSVSILSSTIHDNEALVGGGARINMGSASVVQIANSTFSSNTADGGTGGGLYLVGANSTAAKIVNSTFSGNSAAGSAGIRVHTDAVVDIINCTITENAGDTGDGGIGAFGGSTVTVHNSIIAGNTSVSALTQADASGAFAATSSYNLIGDTTVANLNDSGDHNIEINSADPLLGPLANNGGPTKTHALLSGSSAIDKGSNTKASGASLTTDQRGNSRAHNIESVTDGADGNTDIGAYELIAPTIQASQEFYVDEDSANSTVVGQVVATDADAGTTFQNWTIVSGDDTTFSINSSTGVITVNDNTDLDYELNDTFVLGITVSDGTYTSAPVNVTINVNYVNKAPVLTVPSSLTAINENGFSLLNSVGISIADVDAASGLMTVTITATEGWFAIDDDEGAYVVDVTNNSTSSVTLTGTLAQLNTMFSTLDNLIVYVHSDNDTSGQDTITLTVNDQGNTGSGGAKQDIEPITIDVTPINDAPTIAINNVLVAYEQSLNNVITSSKLTASDPDDAATGLTYTITDLSNLNGTLTRDGVTLEEEDTFTQADINNGLIEYSHDGSTNSDSSFDFEVADGGENGAGPAAGTFEIILVPAISAPPVVNTNEDLDIVFTGATAIEIGDFTGNGGDIDLTITIVGPTGTTLTLTGESPSTGPISLTDSAADLTTALTGMVLTVPADYFGTVSLAIGVKADGATEIFAGHTVQAIFKPVNDNPVNTAPGGQNVDEDGALVFSTGNGNAISIADPDLSDSGYLMQSLIPNVPDVSSGPQLRYLSTTETAEAAKYGIGRNSYSIGSGQISVVVDDLEVTLAKTREEIKATLLATVVDTTVPGRAISRDTTDILTIDIEGVLGAHAWYGEDSIYGHTLDENLQPTQHLLDIFDAYALRMDVLREVFPYAKLLPYATPDQVLGKPLYDGENILSIDTATQTGSNIANRAYALSLAIEHGVLDHAYAVAPRIYQAWGPGDNSWENVDEYLPYLEENIELTINMAAQAVARARSVTGGEKGSHLQIIPENSFSIQNSTPYDGGERSDTHYVFQGTQISAYNVPEGYVRQLMEINRLVTKAKTYTNPLDTDYNVQQIIAGIPAVSTWYFPTENGDGDRVPSAPEADFDEYFEGQSGENWTDDVPYDENGVLLPTLVSATTAAIARGNGAGILKVTLTTSNGSLEFPGAATTNFVTIGNPASKEWVLTGTQESINAILQGMEYTPDAGYVGSDTLTISTNDFGGVAGGTGTPQVSYVPITVNDVTELMTVNTLTDAADANPGDGIADTDLVTPGQQISLRAAIEEANALSLSGPVTINVPLTGTITLSLGQLTISEDVNITGSGVDNLTIDGDELSRVFYVNSGSDVTISDLTITGGEVTGANVNGGGIYNAGNLILDHVTVEGNSTESSGGGVYSTGGSVSILSSTIHDNHALVGGGARINMGSASVVQIANSTFSSNTADGGTGGGLYLVGANSTAAKIVNSTFSGNSAAGSAGIRVHTDAVADIINCTITENTGDTGDGGIGAFGGSTVTVHNSIIAGNTSASVPSQADAAGTFASTSSYNLIGDTTVANLNDSGDHNIEINSADPLLGPLADNGGPTKTHALLSGSSAIDKGSNTKASGASLTTDQRGNTRTHNIAGVTDGADGNTDIGAYELITPVIQASQNFYVDENSANETVVGQVVATDPDAGTTFQNWTIVSGDDTTFSINSSTGVITVNDNTDLDYELNDTFVLGITVSDGTYTSAPVNVTIHVGDTISDGTITVNSTDDAVDASFPEDGIVDADRTTPGRQITLRAAIQEANAHTGPVTINLPEGNYVLDRAGLDKVNATAPDYNDLDISDIGAKFTIVGDGSGLTIVDASGIADSVGEGDRRVFQIASGAEVEISGLTITGGNVANNDGGGIYNAGDLTLDDVVVVNNIAEDSGGGIYSTGTLTIESSTIDDNHASNGGGIYSTGDLTLDLTTVIDNTATSVGGGIFTTGSVTIQSSTIEGNHAWFGGGARFTTAASSIVVIANSTFSENTAHDGTWTTGTGGGLYISGAENTTAVKIVNSTFSGNQAVAAGGIRVQGDAVVDVINCTITENSGTNGEGGIGGWGGSTVTVHNSIIAGNTSVSVPGQADAAGTFVGTSSYNLIGSTTSGVLNTTGGSNKNKVIGSNDPLLGALAYNGGPTKTHLLLTGSQAIDAGDDGFADEYDLLFDQRGEDRIQLGDTSLTIDIGAVEMAFDEL